MISSITVPVNRRRAAGVILFVLLLLFQAGCWVGLPNDGPPGAAKYVGKTVSLQRDILIVSYWFTPISWEIDKKNHIGRKQKIVATLKKGNDIRISGIRSFRTDSGLHYAYRCIDLKTGLEFDLNFEMSDSLGIPKF